MKACAWSACNFYGSVGVAVHLAWALCVRSGATWMEPLTGDAFEKAHARLLSISPAILPLLHIIAILTRPFVRLALIAYPDPGFQPIPSFLSFVLANLHMFEPSEDILLALLIISHLPILDGIRSLPAGALTMLRDIGTADNTANLSRIIGRDRAPIAAQYIPEITSIIVAARKKFREITTERAANPQVQEMEKVEAKEIGANDVKKVAAAVPAVPTKNDCDAILGSEREETFWFDNGVIAPPAIRSSSPAAFASDMSSQKSSRSGTVDEGVMQVKNLKKQKKRERASLADGVGDDNDRFGAATSPDQAVITTAVEPSNTVNVGEGGDANKRRNFKKKTKVKPEDIPAFDYASQPNLLDQPQSSAMAQVIQRRRKRRSKKQSLQELGLLRYQHRGKTYEGLEPA
ncbi:hypothetical protein D1P53_004220 [Cryptococcus gattii VGV]|nr:hypothetical protein D1P53_004220 [Cryptococcus gattii VGV]